MIVHSIGEDHPIYKAIDLGGGQTCNIKGVLRELDRAGYVIVPKAPSTARAYGARVVAVERLADGTQQGTIGWPRDVPLTIGQTILFDLD